MLITSLFETLFFDTKLLCQWMLYFLLKCNNIFEQIIILDLICGFHRRSDSVVFILAALDFSNEGYGFKKFDYFRQKSPIAIKFQHSV